MSLKYLNVNAGNYSHQFHVSVTDEIRQLAGVLACYGINHFSHSRNYSDKSESLFTTHPEFSEIFLREHFHKHAFCAEPHRYKESVVLASALGKPMIEQALLEFQIADVLIFVKPSNGYTDFWYFGAKPNNKKIIDFYFANLDLLESFIDYFKERGGKLLNKIHEHRMCYPGELGDTSSLMSAQIDTINLKNLNLEKLVPHVYDNLFSLAKKQRFTLRELKCAGLLMQGFCPKEIAAITCKSARTVEKQILTLKEKMQSRSLIHLVSQLHLTTSGKHAR